MLPIYTCNTEGFRDFMRDVDAKWRPCNGKCMSSDSLPDKYALGEKKVKSLFAHLGSWSAL